MNSAQSGWVLAGKASGTCTMLALPCAMLHQQSLMLARGMLGSALWWSHQAMLMGSAPARKGCTGSSRVEQEMQVRCGQGCWNLGGSRRKLELQAWQKMWPHSRQWCLLRRSVLTCTGTPCQANKKRRTSMLHCKHTTCAISSHLLEIRWAPPCTGMLQHRHRCPKVCQRGRAIVASRWHACSTC